MNPVRLADLGGEDVPAAEPVGQFAMLSIVELLAHPDNLRDEVKPNPGLVANLKTDGVAGLLQPIIVTAHPDGVGHLIVDGHERVASFQEAATTRPELTHIPAMIRPDLADRAAQLVTMLRTGVHRRQLSSVEEARGVAQLSLAGLSAPQIAKRTGYKRRQVDDALTVAGMAAETARQVVARGLDLHQAAIVQGFADDEQAVARLLEAAENGPIAFDKRAAEARADREETQQREARIAELTAAGVTVLDADVLYGPDRLHRRLTELLHNGQPITPEGHAGCPGHAVAVERMYGSTREAWCCADWRTHQHTERFPSPRPAGGPMSDEQKAERQEVIANNKAMRAANEVRRAWLTDLFGRKTIKGAARYVAETLVARPYFLGRWTQKNATLLDEFLGTTISRDDRSVAAASANDARCAVYALAAIAAAHENEITHDTWRSTDTTTARWFAFLASIGYDLDPVEQLVIDKATAQEATTHEGAAQPGANAPANAPANPADEQPATETPDRPAAPAAGTGGDQGSHGVEVRPGAEQADSGSQPDPLPSVEPEDVDGPAGTVDLVPPDA